MHTLPISWRSASCQHHCPMRLVRKPHTLHKSRCALPRGCVPCVTGLGAAGGLGIRQQYRSEGHRQLTRVNFKHLDGGELLLQSFPAADVQVLQRAAAAWERLCTQEPAQPPCVATRHSGQAPHLVSHSRFLNDSRGAPRLLAGLAGLGAHSPLHAATPPTGPFHEALLSRLSPRLLYAWHRYLDAWKYGSGSDWQQHSNTNTNAASPAAAAASSSAAAPPEQAAAAAAAAHPTHSVDTHDGDPCVGYEGADGADLALCPPDSPLCGDPSHSVDSAEVIDWSDTPNQGWGDKQRVAAACFNRGGSNCTARQQVLWGGSVCRPPLLPTHRGSTNRVSVRSVAVAAGGNTNSSSAEQQQRQQRRQLEQLLVSIVVHGDPGRHRAPFDTSYTVNVDEPSSDEDVTGYDGADAARLLYPQLDPCRSYDEYEIIDWGDVPNDGWGTNNNNASRRNSNGTAPNCYGTSSRNSSGSGGCCCGFSSSPCVWGASLRRPAWLPGGLLGWTGSTRAWLQRAAVAAAAAAGDGGGGGDAGHSTANRPAAADRTHSVDTHDDPCGGYEGADGADLALCPPDSPLCGDPSHSVDSTELIDWSDTPNQGWGDSKDAATGTSSSQQEGSSGASPAAAAAASSVPADGSYRKKLEAKGGRRLEPRPYMNIVNGRWVPPSREQSEAMMQRSMDMGPDEGL